MRKLRNYIAKQCANYDRDSLCLLETTASGLRLCPYFNDSGRVCSYAETSVIPGDAAIEAAYKAERGEKAGAHYCAECKQPFKRRSNRQKYCDPCGQARRRNQQRAANQKYYLKTKSHSDTIGR